MGTGQNQYSKSDYNTFLAHTVKFSKRGLYTYILKICHVVKIKL
jgi:hypothetical protein